MDDRTRPVMLWADEAQFFVSPAVDIRFATTCRSSRVAIVYLTQNLPNLIAVMGQGEAGRAAVDSLIGNLSSRIMHCNGDTVTN